jgi:hypothetical protein
MLGVGIENGHPITETMNVKESESVIEIYFIWLNNLKFVESRKVFFCV